MICFYFMLTNEIQKQQNCFAIIQIAFFFYLKLFIWLQGMKR
jgi:hypothetical protein